MTVAFIILAVVLSAEATPGVRTGDFQSCSGAESVLQFTSATSAFSCATNSSGGAPTTATYLTQTANGSLSAEQAMGALATGIVINATTTGVQSIYAGSSCAANTVARSTNASGALTCSAVVAADISGAVATADALTNNPTDCGANTFAQSIVAAGNLTCAAVNLASADVSGTLAASNGGLGLTTVTDDTVTVANGTVWQSKALPSCSASDSALTYTIATNAFGCNTIAGGSSTDCIFFPLYRWHAITAGTTTTTTCQATTNIGAVANRGDVVIVDMDRYTFAKLFYFGNMTGTQTGTVTVDLYDIAAASSAISTTFATGTTCVNRSSATTDLTAKTGLVPFTARVGDSTAADDPALSSVSVQFCTATF